MMNRIMLVFKNEFISVVSRRSFILTLVLVPTALFLVTFIANALGRNSSSAVAQVFSSQAPVNLSEGYVDQAGIIKALPADVPSSRLVAYASEADAKRDLAAAKINAYYIIPFNYIQNGRLIYVRSDFNPLSGFDQSGLIQNVLRYNLVGGDQALTDRLSQPLNVTYVSLSTQPQRDSGSILAFFLPYAVTMLLYIVIITSSSLMLSSITTEKQNRIIEILMVSVTPIQLLTGKIIALGLAGLLQTVVWGGAGFLLLQISGSSFNLPAAFMLPPSILLWGIVFFILGFTVYASLMAGVGALVPNLREASQATTIIILPMIIPLIFLSAIVDNPNGVISLVLSMFPLTAPIGMMSRLAAGVVVPLWQILIAAGLLVLTAVFIVRSVSQLFRAQTLLSGQEFSVGLFLRSLAGRG